MPRREKLIDQSALTNMIQNLINAKLRSLVEACNCLQDREFLAKILAEEIMAHVEGNENGKGNI